MRFLMPRQGLNSGASRKGSRSIAAFGRRPSIAKRAICYTVAVSLAGCSLPRYPTEAQVDAARKNVPQLESITDGRAYLAVVRDELQDKREYLQNIELALDAGIVSGLVTAGLGTAFHWGGHKTIIAGILTTAVIGVDSQLSIKQQEMIIEKGLGALICVEAQAEATYAAVKPYDVALAKVRDDIAGLDSAIVNLTPPLSPELQSAITLAQADLANAKSWLAVESVPTANIDAALRVGVDTVLQTTVEQLNSVLPDGSAFAKISISPTVTQPPSQNSVPSPAGGPPALAGTAPAPTRTQSLARLPPPDPRAAAITSMRLNLNNDMKAAKARVDQLGPSPVNSRLPTFSCPVSLVQPTSLSISLKSSTISGKPGSALTLTVSGGTAPYFPTVTGDPPLTQGSFDVPTSFATATTAIQTKAGVVPGTYTLVVTDSGTGKGTATFTVTAAPPTMVKPRSPAPAR